jgi:geranylgeranyl pyrophosphate synthase
MLGPFAAASETALRRWLIEPGTPAELASAMEYAVLGGGKRLRPALVLLADEACGGSGSEEALRAAAAIEMLHTYSLVHDDLPAMDDDTLRRGRPTLHVKFGEAMAILAGDALLTRALGVLAEMDSPKAAPLAAELAKAAGPAGMIAGQVGDMELCELPESTEGLAWIHRHKTADLIRAAVRMGGLCGGADAPRLEALGTYGEALGLAFQLVDDLLDVTAEADQLGKTPGKDQQTGKRTYVALLGLDATRQLAVKQTDRAVAALAPLGPAGQKLADLASTLAERTR